MQANDPNLEWLGHVQPTGLVVAPTVLARHGLTPLQQTRADSEAVAETPLTLADPWPFFATILDWPAAFVAGSPGGPPVPDDLCAVLPDAATTLAPTWAVATPERTGWQMLVRIEAPGIAPDARGALAGWEATAHQRLERLLRETGIPTGLLLTEHELRLIHAPRGETSGWLAFPLAALATVGGRPMLGGLKLLLNDTRLFTDGSDRRLPSVLRESRAAQAEVSAKLATQVLGALHELLRGLHAADRARIERLAAQRPAHLYEGLLTVLLRLVFLLYAEDRDLLPSRTDGPARALYHEGYGVRALHARLLADAARNPDTMDERRGAWGRLLALFRLVHQGDGTGWIRGRGGKLFDPAAFPFLLGRDDAPAGTLDLPPMTDGCVLRVLDGLLVLGGETLSYRTLDVEQIGSVYETVMGFTVVTLPGPALAIRAGKNNRTPVFVDLAAVATLRGTERAKHLKENADRGQLPAKVATALAAAADTAALAVALHSIVDERASPGGHILPSGTPLLQPTDERRRSGSHYTPRDLTHPIVEHAFKPAFDRIGEAAHPEDVLALKLCDPAMGSGAFLVEACRQIATRLVAAWARHPGTRPPLAEDEDEDLLARRLVAQRCLYGVDKNPMATDLARLSLWLATLARDHEFTFLDHALKTGDSLVGLTPAQIARLHWDTSKSGLPIFDGFLRDRVREAISRREEIRAAPDDITREIQEARHRDIETRLDPARQLGDAVIAAFFAGSKPKEREKHRVELEMWAQGPRDALYANLPQRLAMLAQGPHPLRPFHWQIEFPEVFDRENPGFDAIVGNPPFAGKNTVAAGQKPGYGEWLQTLHEGAHGNADLVAHFFRRAFTLLRKGGAFGLIATNTIGQGDTRETGLAAILRAGGAILRAIRRLVWPGEAAVVVSVVHVAKGAARSPVLDGRQVRRISAYLVEGDLDDAPAALVENAGKAFQGAIVLGMGFTFDDAAAAKGVASSLEDMRRLIAENSRNAERIFPYFGGEEVNNDPLQQPRRYVIDFGRLSEDEARAGWPDLMAIIAKRVRPERIKQNDRVAREFWWQFLRARPELQTAINGLNRVLTILFTAPHLAVSVIQTGAVFANSLNIFPFDNLAPLAALQSRIHEVWTRFFASSMKDDLRYTPSDCFETFPFCPDYQTDPALEAAGGAYHAHRAALMIARNEGLTKTYNRFHDPHETAADIATLRDLHAAMDRAVLAAYGWHDLIPRAEPVFLTEDTEDDPKYHDRLFWPAPIRDEVLARLLALNADRAATERSLGFVPKRGAAASEMEEETA
jgi:hypothetical protein